MNISFHCKKKKKTLQEDVSIFLSMGHDKSERKMKQLAG